MPRLILNMLAACAVAFVIAAAPAAAAPLRFDFTGTVSRDVLLTGIVQPMKPSRGDWVGQAISGSVTLDLDAAHPSPFTGPGYTQFGATSEFPDATWMVFSLTNPDGSVVTIPGPVTPIPLPVAEGNDAYTYLQHEAGRSGFYAGRTFTNSVTYPQQSIQLWLDAVGPQADALTSSALYENVVFDPAAANRTNYGAVNYWTSADVGFTYAFVIDSLVRTGEVPEPRSALLLALGLAALAGARATRTRTRLG